MLTGRLQKTQTGDPIDEVDLLIPEYQKPYKWTAKHANQLLDDILEAKVGKKEVYRVGTLILHKNEKGYNIVDGQQRTITFALLLRCFAISNIAFLQQKLTENPYNRRNVANNYRSLRRRIKNISEQERNGLAEFIKDNCEMIVVITDDISEAFQFFDSQNARGKKLYPHDLLKAYHLKEMRSLDADATEKVVHTWENMDQKGRRHRRLLVRPLHPGADHGVHPSRAGGERDQRPCRPAGIQEQNLPRLRPHGRVHPRVVTAGTIPTGRHPRMLR